MDDLFGFIRKATRVLVTLLVIAVLVNDGYRLVSAFSAASQGMKAGLNAALDSVKAAPQNSAAARTAAAAAAEARGATLVEYGQDNAVGSAVNNVRVSVTVTVPVRRSVIAAPIIGAVRGVPAQDWYAPAGVDILLRNSKQVNDFGVQP